MLGGEALRVTPIGNGADAVTPQNLGGPGCYRGTISAVASFMRREGPDADPEPLIAACAERAASFGAPEKYVRRLLENARRFAAKCDANQRAEAAVAFEPLSDTDADAFDDGPCDDSSASPRDQRAMRARLGITLLDENSAS